MNEARPADLSRTVRIECSRPWGFRPPGRTGLATHSPSNLGDRLSPCPQRAVARRESVGIARITVSRLSPAVTGDMYRFDLKLERLESALG